MLFETVRVCNGCAERLELHQARFIRSGGKVEPSLAQVIAAARVPHAGEYKVHISYTAQGIHAVHVEPYTPRVVRRMRAVESDVCYSHKDEDRRAFEQLRRQHPDVDELILCRDGWVTDTTYSNLLFGEPGAWYTPEHYLLAGTRRESLLLAGIVQVRPIHRDDIPHFSYLCLINAMLEPGRLMLPTSAVDLP